MSKIWRFILICIVILIAFSNYTIAEEINSQNQIIKIVNQEIENSDLPGVSLSVVKNRKALYLGSIGEDGYDQDLKIDSPMFIGSISKSLTAIAVMQLVDEKKIDLEMPITKYIPYFETETEGFTGKITVRDLLVQESGLSRKNSIPNSNAQITIKERIKQLSTMKEKDKPGKAFNYLNDNYNILGLLIEEVSGQSYAEYMENFVFKPIGMVNTTADYDNIVESKVYGYTNVFGFSKKIKERIIKYDIPSGYILSTIEDMNQYMQFLLDPDKDIISNESIQYMRSIDTNSNYKMGWHVKTIEEGTLIEHSGAIPGHSSHMAFIPETKSGYIYIINKNHLLYNFVSTFKNLNKNFLNIIRDKESIESFPSILVLRVFSIIILIFFINDLWKTKKIVDSNKTVKQWKKHLSISITMLMFLLFGLPLIMKKVLGMNLDLSQMFHYVPDFTLLLLGAIIIQLSRVIVSYKRINESIERET